MTTALQAKVCFSLRCKAGDKRAPGFLLGGIQCPVLFPAKCDEKPVAGLVDSMESSPFSYGHASRLG